MQFKYIGGEFTEWFGFKWMNGTVHDVTDEHAIKKLSSSALFEQVQDVPVKAPKAVAVEVEAEAESEPVVEEPVKKRARRAQKDVTDDDAQSD